MLRHVLEAGNLSVEKASREEETSTDTRPEGESVNNTCLKPTFLPHQLVVEHILFFVGDRLTGTPPQRIEGLQRSEKREEKQNQEDSECSRRHRAAGARAYVRDGKVMYDDEIPQPNGRHGDNQDGQRGGCTLDPVPAEPTA